MPQFANNHLNACDVEADYQTKGLLERPRLIDGWTQHLRFLQVESDHILRKSLSISAVVSFERSHLQCIPEVLVEYLASMAY